MQRRAAKPQLSGPGGAGAIGETLLQLLKRFDLERISSDTFVGTSSGGDGRLFGGFVAAQAVVAAMQTASGGAVHSLHAYFLRPGENGVPIRYEVNRIREGRTFTTRAVIAFQGDEAIFNTLVSLARPEEGIAHQDPMPEAPGPEGLPDLEDVRAMMLGDPSARRPNGAVEVRDCDPGSLDPSVPLPGSRRVWMRPRGTLPDDPEKHVALLVFASDRLLMGTIGRPHGLTWGSRAGASLDHAMWFHRPARFDDWLLYTSYTPAAYAARGLAIASMYTRGGLRIATVAQEALIRIPRRSG